MRRNHVFRSETRIVKRRLIGVERSTRGIQDNNCVRYRVRDATKLAFIFSQLRFRLLEGFDVGACSVPPNNLASLVPQWLHPHEKPAKHSVMATETRFHFARFTRYQELLPFLQQARSILWVDRNLPTRTIGLLAGEARVLMPALVKELVRTIRQIAPGQRGDRIDYLPTFCFRIRYLIQRSSKTPLRPLPFNRDQCDTPSRLY